MLRAEAEKRGREFKRVNSRKLFSRNPFERKRSAEREALQNEREMRMLEVATRRAEQNQKIDNSVFYNPRTVLNDRSTEWCDLDDLCNVSIMTEKKNDGRKTTLKIADKLIEIKNRQEGEKCEMDHTLRIITQNRLAREFSFDVPKLVFNEKDKVCNDDEKLKKSFGSGSEDENNETWEYSESQNNIFLLKNDENKGKVDDVMDEMERKKDKEKRRIEFNRETTRRNFHEEKKSEVNDDKKSEINNYDTSVISEYDMDEDNDESVADNVQITPRKLFLSMMLSSEKKIMQERFKLISLNNLRRNSQRNNIGLFDDENCEKISVDENRNTNGSCENFKTFKSVDSEVEKKINELKLRVEMQKIKYEYRDKKRKENLPKSDENSIRSETKSQRKNENMNKEEDENRISVMKERTIGRKADFIDDEKSVTVNRNIFECKKKEEKETMRTNKNDLKVTDKNSKDVKLEVIKEKGIEIKKCKKILTKMFRGNSINDEEKEENKSENKKSDTFLLHENEKKIENGSRKPTCSPRKNSQE